MALSKTSNSCGNIQAVMWQLRSLMIFNYSCSPKNSCWWFQPIWNIWKLWMSLGIIIPIPMVEHHSLIQTKIPTRESLVITAIIYPWYPWVDASIPPFLGRACATLRRILRGQRLSAPGGEDQLGPCGTHLGDDLLVMGIFLGDWWDFFHDIS